MNEELQQHLMEFVYGLLEEDEANELRERITSDPAVARAYAKVKLQCDLVGRAARFDTPSVAWIRPDESDPSISALPAASTNRSARAYGRPANWIIGVAASGLICLVGSTYWMSSRSRHNESTPVAVVSEMPLQVVLTGPSKLHSEASNGFSILVENQAGTPVSTTLDYRVYDAKGAVSWHDSASTDESGIARFDVAGVSAKNASRLEVTSANDSSTPIVRELEAVPERFVTYLRMDRPLYQPGEELFYRSVTLSRYGLRAEQEVTTSFDIVNANDQQIEGAANVVQTEQGVGSGAVALPSDLPDGEYTLIARSPDNLFDEEWRDFQVRRYEAPRLRKELELAQDSYTVGDQVEIEFSVARVAGEPLADVPLQVQAMLDGSSLAAPEAKTDAEGKSRFSLTLPESIERGEANVSVTVQEGDDPAETITKDIPINLGKVNVDFYPEGGDLAADVPNRVYFHGRDPLGKPTHIEGRIVDANDNDITQVITGHDGRGVFSFTPTVNERYRLMIERPAGVTKEIPLPATSPNCFVTIETGAGVFDAHAPIIFTLHNVHPAEPLIVAAYCRGAMVGQQTLADEGYSAENASFATFRGEISLPDDAQGVIRVTVFDSAQTPPMPIAERLVYRRVSQKLAVEMVPDAETFAPAQAVQLDLTVRDEHNAPIPAVLGIAIVDDAVLNLADDKSTRMPTYFHLLTEIDSSSQLEDANFYLSDKPDSVAALDSLLGTQGWRRFAEVPAIQLAQGYAGGFGGGDRDLSFRDTGASSRLRSLAWAEETALPLSTASTMGIQKTVAGQASRTTRSIASSGWPLALSIVIAGIVLLVMVGVASLRRVGSNRSLRAFAAAVALGSLLVGVLSLPMKSPPTDRTFIDAVPASSGMGEALRAGGTEIAASDFVERPDALGAVPAESYMYRADDTATLSDLPAAVELITTDPSLQDNAAPGSAARFAAPEGRLGGKADAAASEKNEDAALPFSKEKKSASLSPEAPPQPAAMADPSKPPAESDALGVRGRMLAEPPRSVADKNEGRFLKREYAAWSYEARPSISPTGQPSSTIFWHPHFIADESGKATIYFNLPQRPSSFRAIVEAHGADRLGTGELLIDSREP